MLFYHFRPKKIKHPSNANNFFNRWILGDPSIPYLVKFIDKI